MKPWGRPMFDWDMTQISRHVCIHVHRSGMLLHGLSKELEKASRVGCARRVARED